MSLLFFEINKFWYFFFLKKMIVLKSVDIWMRELSKNVGFIIKMICKGYDF